MTDKTQSQAGRGAIAILCLALSACALPPGSRMTPPADIAATADMLDVANRSRATGLLVDESFDVGSYQVRQVRRGAAANSSFSIGSLSLASGHERFSFAFRGQQEWQGRCELQTRDNSLAIKAGTLEDSRARLNCACRSEQAEVSLHLDDEWRPLRGEMVMGATRYAMQQYRFGTSEGGLRSPAVGYRVEQPGNGAGVAAVEVLHPGRIWQQRSLAVSEREPMACLLSALMIYGSR